jgi:hypothetical protein
MARRSSFRRSRKREKLGCDKTLSADSTSECEAVSFCFNWTESLQHGKVFDWLWIAYLLRT